MAFTPLHQKRNKGMLTLLTRTCSSQGFNMVLKFLFMSVFMFSFGGQFNQSSFNCDLFVPSIPCFSLQESSVEAGLESDIWSSWIPNEANSFHFEQGILIIIIILPNNSSNNNIIMMMIIVIILVIMILYIYTYIHIISNLNKDRNNHYPLSSKDVVSSTRANRPTSSMLTAP